MRKTLLVSLVTVGIVVAQLGIPEEPDVNTGNACNVEAQRYLANGYFASAREKFILGLRSAEESGNTREQQICYFHLGLLSHRQGRAAEGEERRSLFKNASTYYKKALQLDPTSVGTLNNLAQLAVDSGDWARTEKPFESALSQATGERWIEVAHNFANYLKDQGQWQRASRYYLMILDRNHFDSQAHRQIVEIYLANDPPALAPYLIDLTNSGQATKALEVALDCLEYGGLIGQLKHNILIASVWALAESNYTLREFKGLRAHTVLSRLESDPFIGLGAEEVVKLHSDSNPQVEEYRWWTDSGTERAATLSISMPTRSEAFRSLLRSLSRKALPEDIKRTRAYLEMAVTLSGQIDVKAHTMLAQFLATAGERDLLRQRAHSWKRELELVNATGSLAKDLVEYHLVMANIFSEFGWRGREAWPYTMEYHLDRAKDAAITDPELMEDVAFSYKNIGFQGNRRLLTDAIDQFRLTARYYRKQGNVGKADQLLAEAEALTQIDQHEKPIAPSAGCAGCRAAGTWIAGGDCFGVPDNCLVLNTASQSENSSFLILASDALRKLNFLKGWSTVCSAFLNQDLSLLHGVKVFSPGDSLARVDRVYSPSSTFRLISLKRGNGVNYPIFGWPSLPGIERWTPYLSPRWTYDGAWSRNGVELLLVDGVRRQILAYQVPERRFLGAWANRTDGVVSVRSPLGIEASPDGLLMVAESGGAWVWLDAEGKPLRKTDILAESRTLSGVLGGIYSWSSVGDELLAFADIELADGNWQSGFISVPIASPSDWMMLHPTPLDSPARQFYRYGQNFVAHVGEAGYFLAMDDQPAIFEVSYLRTEGRAPRRVRSFPGPYKELSTRPLLPKVEGVDAAERIAEAMEKSTGVVGIFGSRQLLYVLARFVSAESGSTTWLLLQIDPRRDALVRSITLPTFAPHLLVVPGPQYWAFVEKGGVRDFGEQDVNSILLIPSVWIEDPRSSHGSIYSERISG